MIPQPTENVNTPILLGGIPNVLHTCPSWVGWRYVQMPDRAKPAKRPVNPYTGQAARVDDPSTWGLYADAHAMHVAGAVDGLGVVLTEDSDLVCIDLDNCLRPDGTLTPIAARVVDLCPNTYIELSPSGTGLHVWGRGGLPVDGVRNDKWGLEIYCARRYMTVTGRQYGGTDGTTVVCIQPAIDKIWSAIERQRSQSRNVPATPRGDNVLTDDDDQLLNRMFASSAGANLRALWDGQWDRYFDNQSAADLSFCSSLAIWTRRDVGRMDRLFRQSGLMRPKWDRHIPSWGQTYGQATISKAAGGAS